MDSNVELYSGERSASYEATIAALAASGAEPGDVVHAFGHSQGAMVTAHLALEGGYDTRTLVSFGVARRGGRSARARSASRCATATIPSPRSREAATPARSVRRAASSPNAPPTRQLGLHDYRLPAHGIGGYTETARMLDASTDPRMDPVRELFDELGGAASIEVTEYSAQRAGGAPASAAAGTFADQSWFFGRRMMPKIQLMSEMMIAATTPHQKSSTRRPQLQKPVIQAVSHSRNALMMRPIRPSVRM